MKQRRKLLVFLVALVLISVWTVRRRDAYVSVDSASEDVESAVKKKKMTQQHVISV